MGERSRGFRPGLLSRLDEVILFKPLTRADIGRIIRLLMADLNRRLADRSLSVELTPEAEQFIIANGYDPVYGARPLKRYLQKTVETLAAKIILADQVTGGDTILVRLSADRLEAVKK